MSGIIKVNKSGLMDASTNLGTEVTNLSSIVSGLSSTLKSIPNHDHFSNVSSKATLLADNLSNIYDDFKIVSDNIKNYTESINEIDGESISDVLENGTNNDKAVNLETNDWTNVAATTLGYTTGGTYSNPGGNYVYSYTTGPSGTIIYNNNNSNNGSNSFSKPIDTSSAIPGREYNYEGIEEYIKDIKGTSILLPAGLGAIHTYMGWQCITAPSSNQYKLREVAGMKFDEEGFAKIGDRYVVATTTTFGQVGDFIDVYQEDGTVIKCVIGDIKNQADAGCNQWGHNDGHCVVEFVVDQASWYGTRKSVDSFHPEWNRNISKIVNKGNYFDLIKTDAAKVENDSTKTKSFEDLIDESEAVTV